MGSIGFAGSKGVTTAANGTNRANTANVENLAGGLGMGVEIDRSLHDGDKTNDYNSNMKSSLL